MIHTIVVAIIAALLGIPLASPASASWTQPYGGCKEAWQAPRSTGAKECRAHGWTVRPNIVVGPHAVLRFSRLDDCANGGTPCLGTTGQRTYWVGPQNFDGIQKIHWIWSPSPRTTQWRWVRSGLADALAEGSYRHATTRDWSRCVTYLDSVRCPDGLKFSW